MVHCSRYQRQSPLKLRSPENKGTGHNKFVFEEDPPCLGWGGGGGAFEDTTYLINITDQILLVLKFEITQKYYLASKSEHC